MDPDADDLRRQRSRTFSQVAEAYDHGRPTYPERAVRWLSGAEPRRVLELGAGTGKLTEQLVALGHRVTPTDPSGPMLTRLVRRLGTASAQCAAERLPFRAGSFDVVVVAQAFHWFDTQPALAEIARVLRVGGSLSLVWNYRDERVPWVRRLSDLIGREPQDDDVDAALAGRTDFEAPERATYRFWQDLDEEGLVDLVASRSYVVAMDAAERARVLAGVRELYASYGRGPHGMRLPYTTQCYRSRLMQGSYEASWHRGASDGSDSGAARSATSTPNETPRPRPPA